RADPQRAHEVVIVVLQELGRMARQGVDSAALARVSAARAMADSAEGVRDLHWAARLLEPIHRMPALEGRLTRSIGALDQADVQDVLARHLDPRRAAIAALVPDAAGFIRKLTAAAIDLGPEASSGSPGAAGLAGPRLVLTRDDFEPMEEDVAP
ncbi:MAG TPA: hypothetical protein VFP98_09870, partial [Candidatus Polarisedimenticolia bacterium]|nr:hypothetical protein [Candidatus Polarisedimenticolia bacterium]